MEALPTVRFSTTQQYGEGVLMQWLLLICLMVFSSGEVLVLKNGKKMLADRVERNNGHVAITRKGQTFSLPESAVNWDASAKATEELQRKLSEREAAQRKEAEAKRKKEEDYFKLKEPSSLTRENYQSRRVSQPGGKIELNYRLEGNSIIVGLKLNGQGPFDIILDTGASKTVIDPALLNRVGGEATGQAMPMTGVAGKIINAQIYRMDELSLSGARVSRISVLGNRIDALVRGGVCGLLGQDFLNHFIVNINTATQLITLEPHNLHNNQGREEINVPAFVRRLETFFGDLDQVTRQTLGYADLAVRHNRAERRDLSQARAAAARLKRESGELFSKLNKLDDQSLSQEGKQSVKRLRTCQPGLQRIFRSLDSLNSALSQNRKLNDAAGTVSAYKQDLVDKAGTVRGAYNAYRECI